MQQFADAPDQSTRPNPTNSSPFVQQDAEETNDQCWRSVFLFFGDIFLWLCFYSPCSVVIKWSMNTLHNLQVFLCSTFKQCCEGLLSFSGNQLFFFCLKILCLNLNSALKNPFCTNEAKALSDWYKCKKSLFYFMFPMEVMFQTKVTCVEYI